MWTRGPSLHPGSVGRLPVERVGCPGGDSGLSAGGGGDNGLSVAGGGDSGLSVAGGSGGSAAGGGSLGLIDFFGTTTSTLYDRSHKAGWPALCARKPPPTRPWTGLTGLCGGRLF